MFPKNKINILYRLLCLLSFMAVIVFTKSTITLIVLLLIYCFLGLSEKSFRNIEFMVIGIILLLFCYLLDNYLLLRIILSIDYIFYFLDTSYYFDDEDIEISQKDYVRFANKKKKKGSSDLSALYVTIHLVLLVIAIVVG